MADYRVIGKTSGGVYGKYYTTGSDVYNQVISKNRLNDAEFGKVGYMINASDTLTEKKNLPIVKITFIKGVTYCAFPFDWTDLTGSALAVPDVSDIFNPKYFASVEDDQGVSVTSNGTVWSGSYNIEPNKGYKVTANVDVEFYILEKLTAWGGSGQVITLVQGWNLVPYSMIISRTIEDSGILGSIIKRISDGNGKESYYDSSEFHGNLDKLYCGKAYWMFKSSAGSLPTAIYRTDQNTDYYPSGTDIPEFINDIPRDYDTNPDNWLWNNDWALGQEDTDKSSQHLVFWSRAKNWSGRYILGDRIEYVAYDDENDKYLYKVLPPGENDWMLSFRSIDDIFYCCGATKLNDLQFVDVLESSTLLDPNKWDPYKNSSHKALLTNPEDYTNDGKDYGKYIQGVSTIYTQDISGNHPHFPALGKKVFTMYYDSVLNKFYWMKEVFSGTNNLLDATMCTGEREIIHHNVYQSNQSFSSSYDTNARDLIPIKSETTNFG